jgi:hypothetical protein
MIPKVGVIAHGHDRALNRTSGFAIPAFNFLAGFRPLGRCVFGPASALVIALPTRVCLAACVLAARLTFVTGHNFLLTIIVEIGSKALHGVHSQDCSAGSFQFSSEPQVEDDR